MDPMMGMIFMMPWAWLPTGYAFCQGQLVTVSQYAALFSLVGNMYGGDGQVSFGLPNLQGRLPIGVGQATSGSGINYALGAAAGSEIAAISAANLPGHTHTATFTPTTTSQSVTVPANAPTPALSVTPTLTALQTPGVAKPLDGYKLGQGGPGGNAATIYVSPSAASATGVEVVALSGLSVSLSGTASVAAATLPVTPNLATGGTVSVNTAGNGAATPISVVQPSLALNFIIAVYGIYPDRPS